MKAYNATSNESHIPPQALITPPTGLPSSLVLSLSPMFDPRDFFLLEEILPSHKRACSQASFFTSALPQVFEIRESSHKTSLEHHEEQIKTILNHLDKLPLKSIKSVEEKIEGLVDGLVIIQRDFDSLETKLQKARTQIAKLQREQMGHNDKILLARVRNSTLEMIIKDIQATIKKLVDDSVTTAQETQAATMANTNNTNGNTEQRETHVARKCSYKEFMSYQPFNFKGTEGVVGLIRWFERTESWNSFAQPIGIEEACKITWSEFKKLLIKKYRPRTKVKKMEDEFYNLAVKGNDLKTYIRRFHELEIFCPIMVPNSGKLVEVFIRGLPRSIEGNVIASKPQTLEEVITIT
nr:reverse transcriptase domain-containing protein [Tanacetum cinerariifolium]